MDLPRSGWALAISFAILASAVVPAAIGLFYGVGLAGALVSLLLLVVLIAWELARRGADPGLGRGELLDALTGEDTSPRSAQELVREEEPELSPKMRDPTAWDR